MSMLSSKVRVDSGGVYTDDVFRDFGQCFNF